MKLSQLDNPSTADREYAAASDFVADDLCSHMTLDQLIEAFVNYRAANPSHGQARVYLGETNMFIDSIMLDFSPGRERDTKREEEHVLFGANSLAGEAEDAFEGDLLQLEFESSAGLD